MKLRTSAAVVFGLVLIGIITGCGQSKTEEMLDYLEVEEPTRRKAACMRLGMMGSNASSAYDEILEHYRNDPSESVRADCLEALGKIGGRENTVKILTGELENSSEAMKLHAARGLGELGASGAIRPLSELFEHDAPEVRETAATALQKIGDPKALPVLREHMEIEKNADVRNALENAIYIIESESS